MEAVCILLTDDGTFIVEVPWAKEMLERAEFDNMYHEHVSEFSVLSMVKLAEAFGLEVSDVTFSHHLGRLEVQEVSVFDRKDGPSGLWIRTSARNCVGSSLS